MFYQAIALSLLVCISALDVSFAVTSLNNNQNLGYLTDKMETNTENYFFVTGAPTAGIYNFNSTTNYISLLLGDIIFNTFMGSTENNTIILAIGYTVKPEVLRFDDKGRLINWNYWACLNVPDPKGLSSIMPIIYLTNRGNQTAPFKTCTLVALTMVPLGTLWDPQGYYNSSTLGQPHLNPKTSASMGNESVYKSSGTFFRCDLRLLIAFGTAIFATVVL